MTQTAQDEVRARECLAKHGIVDGFNLPVLPGYTVAVNPDAVVAAVMEAFRSSDDVREALDLRSACHKFTHEHLPSACDAPTTQYRANVQVQVADLMAKADMALDAARLALTQGEPQ